MAGVPHDQKKRIGEDKLMIKTKKNAFLMSLTSLILCVAMLVGSTFAWFTDTVTSGANKIIAGNLDVEVSYKDGDTWKTIEGADSLLIRQHSGSPVTRSSSL